MISFLNWLTAVPALICLDDAFLAKFFAPFQKYSASLSAYLSMISGDTTTIANVVTTAPTRKIINVLFGALIFRLSIPVVQNLLSKRQLMNASFDKLRLINTYGAFGVVSEEREELIISSAENVNGPWKEYEFKVKVGDVYRRPRWISPYHYRMDWQMWIAACSGSIQRSPWIYNFLCKLLQRDEKVLGLLANDPWTGVESSNGDEYGHEQVQDAGANEEKVDPKQTDYLPMHKTGQPRYIRIDRYKYKFYKPQGGGKEVHTNNNNDNGGKKVVKGKPYWVREYIGRFYPKQGVATEQSLMDDKQKNNVRQF
mmetsp:Transcript_21453/g.27274  ORF Transcript_21453/g.27274 Transcript_21453/m.27274 type:complete len:312 (-) Transcript_21453:3-938(-)